MVSQVFNLLMLDDTELSTCILEFFSRFTSIGREATGKVIRLPGNIVKLLVPFMTDSYKGVSTPPPSSFPPPSPYLFLIMCVTVH